jgi:hypothetical protein
MPLQLLLFQASQVCLPCLAASSWNKETFLAFLLAAVGSVHC